MTTHRILCRPLSALAVIAALAAAIVLTAAPSTARAETGNQLIMSDGNISCPPCGFFQVRDQDGLSFRDVAVEVQNGNELVITADVTVAGTAGKGRTGSVVFSSFMDYTDDAIFLDSIDDACMPSQMSRNAGDQACAAIGRALHDASTAAAGIIMRDGGICDPIRHMGC